MLCNRKGEEAMEGWPLLSRVVMIEKAIKIIDK